MSDRDNYIRAYTFPHADGLEEEICALELEHSQTYESTSLHRHNYFELFFFQKGGGVHQIDFKEHQIEGHSMHIVTPGSLHRLERKAGTTGKVLLFTRSFLYSLIDFTPSKHLLLWQAKAIFSLSDREVEFVQMCLSQIEDELKVKRIERYKVLASLLQMLFVLLMRQAPEQITAGQSLVDRFLERVELQFSTPKSASQYAAELDCSLNQLNQSLSLGGYLSAQATLIARKILEAKRLLVHTDWTSKEIGYHLGYNDPDYFGRVFKQHTGKTVSDFAAQNRQR